MVSPYQSWTRQSLRALVAECMPGRRMIVVSNREPYIHTRAADGTLRCNTPASGLTSAVDPILRATSGVWIALGSGDADRDVVDAADHIAVPPGQPAYTLRRVWLPPHIENDYYNGLSNEGLWPLCHVVFHRPRFEAKHWESYRVANESFAKAVLEEAAGQPAFVLIHDYHLALLPRMLKARDPNLAVAQFWHIPWPDRDTFRAFPWKQELLEGMLGSDLLGFHLRYHCSNFLDTVDDAVEALVDSEHRSVTREGHITRVRPFPSSIDFDEHTHHARSPAVSAATSEWWMELGRVPEFVGIGIDRIDYTKGIPERLAAVHRLFELHPEYLGRFTFVQVGVPSRVAIRDYDELNRSIVAQVDALNRKWARGSWRPVVLIRRHVNPTALMALHLMADFCVVSSLHDGMNLVAKEFVASRFDGEGVLILSAFTGAAGELTDAILINPFAIDELAAAMDQALTMPATERRRRMNRLRAVVSTNNVYRWAGMMVSSLSGLEGVEPSMDGTDPAMHRGAA
jgi:trehalose-6-phosphate synthase